MGVVRSSDLGGLNLYSPNIVVSMMKFFNYFWGLNSPNLRILSKSSAFVFKSVGHQGRFILFVVLL